MPNEQLKADGRRVILYGKDERPKIALSAEGLTLLESKGSGDGDAEASGPRVAGRALVFDTDFPRMGYTMRVASGSLDRYMKQNDGTMGRLDVLYNHEPSDVPYASTEDGSLRTRVDKEALHYEFDLDLNLERHRELYTALAAGRIDRSSAAFFVLKEEWDDEQELRTLTELDFTGGEISVVRIPANPEAEAHLVSGDEPDAELAAETPEERFDASVLNARLREVGIDLTLAEADATIPDKQETGYALPQGTASPFLKDTTRKD